MKLQTLLFILILSLSVHSLYGNVTDYSFCQLNVTSSFQAVSNFSSIKLNIQIPGAAQLISYGVFVGSLVILLLINLTFFFKLRHNSYFLFSALILFNLVFLLKNYFLKLDIVSFSTFSIMGIYTILFSNLLKLNEIKPKLARFLKKISFLFLILGLSLLFLSIFYLILTPTLTIYLSILYFFILVIFSFWGISNKMKFSGYFIFSSFFLFAEAIFILLYNKLNNENPAFVFMQLGSFLSVVTIAYSLMLNFINQLKDSQQQVIFKLEEMNNYKEELNLELEDKVKKRTVELEKANDLLNYQNKEIESIVQNLAEANEQILEQKELIEDTHFKITESINSASHIQAAMLPKHAIFERYFKEYFILYKPRDIVSGDFYWIKRIGKKIIFSAADCTGHGVPGAFVSMLGISLLTEIVRKKETRTAAKMLDELRIALKLSLQQKGRDNELKEGIDMVLCILDTETQEMEFAGANNSIYLIRKKGVGNLVESDKIKIDNNSHDDSSDSYLIELKGNHQPIGAYRKERPFNNHKIQLCTDDILYLFSDGFVDQFGGEKGYKFRTRPFKKFLLNIKEANLESQKQLLDTKFNEWRGRHRQLDDVLILGIKI